MKRLRVVRVNLSTRPQASDGAVRVLVGPPGPPGPSGPPGPEPDITADLAALLNETITGGTP